MKATLAALALFLSTGPAAAQAVPSAVIADPPLDPAHPAAMVAFQLPSAGSLLNAVLYLPAGASPHPALLLLHGFPGNEQNLDLAQAARRAGWAVLTLHYRGSWGSPGAFSYAHCAEDAAAAAHWLENPANAAKYGIDPRRVAIAGHSMGGIMAARTAADDKALLGAFLIDPWDTAAEGRANADPVKRQAFVDGEVRGDMPPLAGTSIDALLAEMATAGPRLDLAVATAAIAPRPLTMVYAARALAADAPRIAAAARAAPGARVALTVMPTDHSFSDRRIALAGALVDWLAALPR